MTNINTSVINECRHKLLQTKEDVLNRIVAIRRELANKETRGDEADLSVSNLEETQSLTTQHRLRTQLFEIEAALYRIHKGEYGRCEETEEPIEVERLMAIPWTRLSIEGAEIRDSLKKKYAQF